MRLTEQVQVLVLAQVSVLVPNRLGMLNNFISNPILRVQDGHESLKGYVALEDAPMHILARADHKNPLQGCGGAGVLMLPVLRVWFPAGTIEGDIISVSFDQAFGTVHSVDLYCVLDAVYPIPQLMTASTCESRSHYLRPGFQ